MLCHTEPSWRSRAHLHQERLGLERPPGGREARRGVQLLLASEVLFLLAPGPRFSCGVALEPGLGTLEAAGVMAALGVLQATGLRDLYSQQGPFSYAVSSGSRGTVPGCPRVATVRDLEGLGRPWTSLGCCLQGSSEPRPLQWWQRAVMGWSCPLVVAPPRSVSKGELCASHTPVLESGGVDEGQTPLPGLCLCADHACQQSLGRLPCCP